MRAVVLLAAVVLFVSPTGAAQTLDELCIITVMPNESFSEILVRADEVYNESGKQELAKRVDKDHDGTVTSSEAASYENGSYRVAYDERVSGNMSVLGHKRLFVDEKGPTRVVFHTDLSNAVGPTDNIDDWLVTEVREYSFPGEKLQTHRLQGGDAAYPHPRAVVEFVVFKAPEDWLVHRINGELYDRDHVALGGFDTHRVYTVDYADGPGKDYALPAIGEGPAPFAWTALAAIAVLAVAIRRRTQA